MNRARNYCDVRRQTLRTCCALATDDPERNERVAARLKAGVGHIDGGGIEYGTPFGGYKKSGNGREGGLMGLEDYLETKTLHGLD